MSDHCGAIPNLPPETSSLRHRRQGLSLGFETPQARRNRHRKCLSSVEDFVMIGATLQAGAFRPPPVEISVASYVCGLTGGVG